MDFVCIASVCQPQTAVVTFDAAVVTFDAVGALDAAIDGAIAVGNPDASPGELCIERYGTALGFELCSATATSCTLAAMTNGTCNALCTGLSGSCLDALENNNTPGQACVAQGNGQCSDDRSTNICVCTQ